MCQKAFVVKQVLSGNTSSFGLISPWDCGVSGIPRYWRKVLATISVAVISLSLI